MRERSIGRANFLFFSFCFFLYNSQIWTYNVICFHCHLPFQTSLVIVRKTLSQFLESPRKKDFSYARLEICSLFVLVFFFYLNCKFVKSVTNECISASPSLISSPIISLYCRQRIFSHFVFKLSNISEFSIGVIQCENGRLCETMGYD